MVSQGPLSLELPFLSYWLCPYKFPSPSCRMYGLSWEGIKTNQLSAWIERALSASMERKLCATNTPGCLVSVVRRNDQTITRATLTSYHCATQTSQFVSSASTPEKQRQTQTEIQLNKSITISPGNLPSAHFKRPLKPLCSTMQFINCLSPSCLTT